MPDEPKFKIGQTVVFVNPYGVNWGEKVITAHGLSPTEKHVYSYEGMDPSHFMTSEDNLFEVGDPQIFVIARERQHEAKTDLMY